MRLHEYGGLENLALEHVPVPHPGEGEVRVRVDAAGVNFADILMIAGEYQLRPELPFSPGFEIAGVIDATGPGVDDWSVGSRVTATPWYGGYAEQVVLSASSVFALPSFISPVTAVSATVTYGTSYHALADRVGLGPGETLLVTGATGGVGSAAVQIGKLLGARVTAAVGSEAKVQAARDLGAEEVVVYDPAAPSLRDQLKALTGGRGFDVILDPVGGDVFDQCVRALAVNGRLAVIGFTSGRIPRLPTNLVLLKESSVSGVFWGAFREREPDRAGSQLDHIWDRFHAGDLRPSPTATYPLESAAAVLCDVANRRVVGKAVLLIDPDQGAQDV